MYRKLGDDGGATVTLVAPFGYDDWQRLQRAVDHVSAPRGEAYTMHDLVCDSVSLAVKDIEAGYSNNEPPVAACPDDPSRLQATFSSQDLLDPGPRRLRLPLQGGPGCHPF